MSHFAKVVDGIVKEVIVVEQEFINEGHLGDPSLWIQTSYNTRGNVHYGKDNLPDNGIALRGNYAGIDYIYDKENDVFYAPKPFDSWVINTNTWTWESPIPYPTDGKEYNWNESSLLWEEIEL